MTPAAETHWFQTLAYCFPQCIVLLCSVSKTKRMSAEPANLTHQVELFPESGGLFNVTLWKTGGPFKINLECDWTKLSFYGQYVEA